MLCRCRQLYYQELVGKAKDKAAKEEAKKAEARDEFTRLLRHTKSLKLDSCWEDVKPDLETHSAYKDVSPTSLHLSCYSGNPAEALFSTISLPGDVQPCCLRVTQSKLCSHIDKFSR